MILYVENPKKSSPTTKKENPKSELINKFYMFARPKHKDQVYFYIIEIN